MKKLIGAVVLGVAGMGAQAAGNATFIPNNPLFMPGGIVLIPTPGGAIAGAPACATQQGFALDANSVSGKPQFAGYLAAVMAGKTINIIGTGTCTLWGDRENVSTMQYSN